MQGRNCFDYWRVSVDFLSEKRLSQMTYWNSMCACACIHADTRHKINLRDCSPWNRVQMIEEWSSLIFAWIALYQIWHSRSRNYDNFLFHFWAKISSFHIQQMSKWKRIFRSLRDIEDVPLRRKLIFSTKTLDSPKAILSILLLH